MVIIEKGVEKNVSAGPRGMLRRLSSSISTPLSALICAGAVCAAPIASLAQTDSGLGPTVSISSLPREAQQTERLIRSGGPFRYSQDGVVFANREGHLARQPRGYYHEYTVPTPDARTRGARRIVCGGASRTEPDACFYTEDHYNSFHRIVK